MLLNYLIAIEELCLFSMKDLSLLLSISCKVDGNKIKLRKPGIQALIKVYEVAVTSAGKLVKL